MANLGLKMQVLGMNFMDRIRYSGFGMGVSDLFSKPYTPSESSTSTTIATDTVVENPTAEATVDSVENPTAENSSENSPAENPTAESKNEAVVPVGEVQEEHMPAPETTESSEKHDEENPSAIAENPTATATDTTTENPTAEATVDSVENPTAESNPAEPPQNPTESTDSANIDAELPKAAASGRIPDLADPQVLDFGSIKINLNFGDDAVQQPVPQGSAQQPGQPPFQILIPKNPSVPPVIMGPDGPIDPSFIPTASDMYTMDQFARQMQDNLYAEYIKHQMDVAGQPGGAVHKVDEYKPPRVEAPKVEDKVDTEGLNKVDLGFQVVQEPKPEVPEIIKENMIPAPTEEHPAVVENYFDNSALFGKYPYLAEIQDIANKSEAMVQYVQRSNRKGQPIGLIEAHVYTLDTTNNWIENQYKGFTIDTGTIIDNQIKVWPGIVPYGYEFMSQAYRVLVRDPSAPKGTKPKNILNRKLFENIFNTGFSLIDPKDKSMGLYSPELLALNRKVALITIKTNRISGDTRRYIRDRLLKADRAGVFQSAVGKYPNARFAIIEQSDDGKHLKLTSRGVPSSFGGPIAYPGWGCEIVFDVETDKDGNEKPKCTVSNWTNAIQ